MRFGGHQTFAIRGGWLYKGLRMVVEDPQRMDAPDVADWLGVGRNMAKSIHHWLQATGLAERELGGGRRTKALRPTRLGETIWKRDPYFLLPGTWWAVHVQLVNRPALAFTWNWFFNVFSSVRFERPVCVESLRRRLAADGGRMASPRTLDRDVACLLRSYSVSVPRPEDEDPEDVMECPLSELGIMLHSRQTGFYHVERGLKPIPFELFAYALSVGRQRWLGRQAAGREAKGPQAGGRRSGRQPANRDRSLTELVHEAGAPGRVFAMTAEALYELVAGYEAEGRVRLDGQAGERIVRLAASEPATQEECIARYYDTAADRVGEQAA